MRAHVAQAQRARVVDQHAQDAAAAGQVTDRAMRLLVDPTRQEPLELLAPVVEHSDRGVAGVGQLLRDIEQAVEHRLGI